MPILALMGFSLFLGVASFPTGNAVAPAIVATPGHSVTLTAYNAVAGQTDSTPLETASGAFSNPEVVAARSQNLRDELPFGTIIELDGSTVSSGNTCGFDVVAPIIGYRVITDSMNARYSDRIDVLIDTKANFVQTNGREVNAANVLGICKGVTIRVVGHVAVKDIPSTQAGLAKLVGKPLKVAVK